MSADVSEVTKCLSMR